MFRLFCFSIKNSDQDFIRKIHLYFWDRSLKLHGTSVVQTVRYQTFQKGLAFIPVRSLIADFQKRRRFVRFLFGYLCRTTRCSPYSAGRVRARRRYDVCKRKRPVSRRLSRGENVFFDRKKNGRVASLLNDTLRDRRRVGDERPKSVPSEYGTITLVRCVCCGAHKLFPFSPSPKKNTCTSTIRP